MKKFFKTVGLSALVVLALTSFNNKTKTNSSLAAPASLYDTIVALDARWEDAYNHCKLDVMEELISEDLEFYHDQGGLLTSKKKLNEALKANICGKVTRELKEGSIEVYAIKGYGAVEMGQHGFHNSQEPSSRLRFSKFVHLWKRDHGKWQITRVISLH
jgi:hypothetical protein